MKNPKNKVITLILLLVLILSPCSTYNVEAAVITGPGIILAAKIISWTATGLSAAKTTAETVYQQLVSAESMRLYKQRLSDLDISLDKLKLKIIVTGPKEVEKLRKLLLKREFILQEKIGLGTVVRAIEENRDAIVKKKIVKEIKSVFKGYVVGLLVPKAASAVVDKGTAYVLTKAGEDMVGAVHTLQDTVSKMPADLKEAYLEKKISKEDKEFHDTLGAERSLTRLRVAMLEAEFDKYISEVVKPAFERYMTTGKDDVYSQLPPEIRKLVRGEYEAKIAERLREREKQLEEYRRMRLEALKKQQEEMRKKQEMAQKRLKILQNNPEVVKGFKKIVAKKPVGDDDKLAQYIASVALASGKIVAKGAKIPPKQKPEEEKKPEVIAKEEPDLMLEEKVEKKKMKVVRLEAMYRKKWQEFFSKYAELEKERYEISVLYYRCSRISDNDKYDACYERVDALWGAMENRWDRIRNNHYSESTAIMWEMYSQLQGFLPLLKLSTATPPEEIEEYLKQYRNKLQELLSRRYEAEEEFGQYWIALGESVRSSGDTPANRQLLEKVILLRKKTISLETESLMINIRFHAIRTLSKEINE